jgi:S-adenosylmethionine decarboxylase
MRALCQHTLLEFHQCDPSLLEHSREVKKLLCKAVAQGGGTIVKAVFHNFSPYGVSGVVVITESHVTIHTWPEYGYAAVDIFSCSEKLNHSAIREGVKAALGAKKTFAKSFKRGFVGKLQAPTPKLQRSTNQHAPKRLLTIPRNKKQQLRIGD